MTSASRDGSCWDGASIPRVFSWFLKSYDTKNSLYTFASLVHDYCYASECVEKDVADDFFRGIMRDSGISRLKASTAEWCVQTFAKNHYGVSHDRFGLRFMGKLSTYGQQAKTSISTVE